MRYYDIALYIFLFNLVLGFLPVLMAGVFEYTVGEADGFGRADVASGEAQLAEQINDVYTPVWSELNWLVENVRLVVQGVATFITTLSKATILFPVLWYELGAAYFGGSLIWAAFVTLLSTPFYFVYFMAIMQWATGRSAKDAQ